jgi:hypothetical protein
MTRTHKKRGGFSLSSLFSSAKRGAKDIASGVTSGVKYVGKVGKTGVRDVAYGVKKTVRRFGGSSRRTRKHRRHHRHHKRRGGYKNPNVVSSYAPITGGYANPNVKYGYAPVSEGYSNQVPLTTPYQYNSLDRAYPSSSSMKGGYRNPNVEVHLNELSDAYPSRLMKGGYELKRHQSRRVRKF